MMTSEKLQADKQEIKRFLDVITEGWNGLDGDPKIEVRFLAKGKSPSIARFSTDWTDEAVDHIAMMNGHGLNSYMCINPVSDANIPAGEGAKDTDIMAAFFCFADADDAEGMKNILSFAGPKFTMSVKTGTVPFVRGHAYWRLEEPCLNMDAWRGVQKAIAASLKTDPVVHNPSRIMRIGGTVSWPDAKKIEKGYVNEVVSFRTEFQTDRDPVPFDRMMRAFPPIQSAPLLNAPAPMGAGLQIDLGQQAMDRALAEQAIMSGDNWHQNVIRLVASYVSKGLTDSEIHSITDRFTQGDYTVDDTRREVQKAIDGARDKGWTPEPQMTPREALSAQTIQLEPEQGAAPATAAGQKPRAPIFWAADAMPMLDASYMVKGWLGQQQMSVVYGPSNVGKSFFCLDLAYCVAAGIEWRGHKVKGGAVLYLATEGGNAFRNRVYALHRQYAAGDVPLAIRASPVNLLNPEADMPELGALCKEIEQQHGKLALIVVDTLSRAMAGGNENGPEDMTSFISNIDALRDYTGAHTMIVHHTGKDAAQGARGHSSLRAATDTEIELEVKDALRTANATKQRDLEPAKPFAFKLKVHELGMDSDGDQVTTCTIQEADDAELQDAKQKRPKGRNQIALIEAFNQMRHEGIGEKNPGGVGWPDSGKYWIIDAQDFETFARGKLTGANPRSTFKQAYESLIIGGYMTQNDGYVWISAKEGRV